MNILEIKDLKKIYRIKSKNKKEFIELKALDGVDLTVKSGEYISIVGPSGSGKSTLMQIMGLLDNATEGSIKFLGKDITRMSDNEISDLRRNYIGFVFQFFNLLPRTTALDNVNLPLIYSRKKDPDRASNLLDMVGLKERKKHKPNQLSGGQQQRVAIARALVNDPKIIFADEPTGNISQVQSEEVMSYFERLNELGVTIVLITHDPKVARHAKRIITVKDGKIESDCINSEVKQIEIAGSNKEENNDLTNIGIDNNNDKENSSTKFLQWFNLILPVFNVSFLKENISVAYKSLISNKFRTFLSMLGIMIGIAAVVTMVSLGEGTKQEIKKQYEEFGTNMIQIQRNWMRRAVSYNRNNFVTTKDYELLKTLKKEYPIEDISRLDIISSNVSVSYSSKNFTLSNPPNTAYSADSSYAKINNLKFKLGSFFTEQQEKDREKVCVIGTTIYKNLFDVGENPIGKKIYIYRSDRDEYGNEIQMRSLFTVLGVINLTGSNQWADQGETIIIPYSTGESRFIGSYEGIISAIQVKVKNVEDIEFMKDVLTHKLAELHGVRNVDSLSERERPIMVRNATDFIDSMAKSSGVLSTLLIIIASISLFIGGIGIMNIMIVSVKERTREIGLRKALGARKLDVMFQFITEAVMIGLIGGGVGIIVGALVSFIISLWVASILSWTMVFIAFTFSFIVALIFGFLPAKRASELSPVEALRYE